MDTKRIVIGTIAGSIVLYIVGYLIFSVAVADFYAANTGMAGVFKEPNLQWALAVGNLPMAVLITLCLTNRAPTVVGGLIIGGILGFLVWLHADLSLYAFTNLFNLTVTLIDPVLSAIPSALAGAVIAAVLARMPKTAGLQAAE